MAQYIDKSALVAEIDRWIKLLTNEKNQEGSSQIDKLSLGGRIAELQEVKVFLNTLEVKEVDLEKKIKDYFDSQPIITRSKGVDYRLIPTGVDIAKHFFELGLKAQKGE